MSFNYWGETDKGKVRKKNEDFFDGIVTKNTLFMIIADGFGINDDKDGQSAGAVAVNEIKRYIEKYYSPTGCEYVKDFIEKCFYTANRVISAYRKAYFDNYSGFGASLTICAVLPNNEIIVGHIGNTRLYILRKGEVIQGTKDYTSAQKLVDGGKITKEEYITHPERVILTNGLGYAEDITPQIFEGQVIDEDIIIMLSDGVYNLINDDEIAYVIKEAGDIKGASKWLVKNANDRGGFDNLTAMVSYIKEN